MKQYPIWNEVHTPDYSNQYSKSFGCRTKATNNIKIGTSSRNSFEFLDTEIKVKYLENVNIYIYSFYVDGSLVKEAEYNPKTKDCHVRFNAVPKHKSKTGIVNLEVSQ